MVKNENWGTRSWRKFRRERTREKFRRLKFQPVLPSSHNRDLRKLPRGRWREVRSKENRESSTAKRDFHPFYLLFPLLLSFSFLFSSFFLPSTLCETRSNRPFEHTTGLASAIPFPPLGEKEEEEEEGKENCKYRDQTRNGNEGEGEGKGLENCEEGREGKDENLEGSSKLKEISDDMHVFLPPPHFSTGRNFPGGNFEKQPRREGNFFYR